MTDPAALIDAMRARGADRFDPVAFHFIETLAERTTAQPSEVRGALDRRLAEALAEYGERFDHAERDARDMLARGTARFPEAAAALRQHCAAGDFGGLQRLLVKLEAQRGSGPLAALLAHIARHTPEGAAGGARVEPQGELKAARYFGSTWARLSADRELSHALAQGPVNAGPLNSHFLVLQSLRLMRDISPAYLVQFMSYVDALLWLDQADDRRSPAQNNALRRERGKKRK